jgi:hypothetical protein
MSERYLIKTTEVWRVPDNEAADAMEEEFRADELFTLNRWGKVDKNRKDKGEIVDEWVQVTAVKIFNVEKEPDSNVRPEYK